MDRSKRIISFVGCGGAEKFDHERRGEFNDGREDRR
jgi:hypothetical protein